jgi:hypothetical protein
MPPLEGSVTSATAAIFVGIAQVHEEVHLRKKMKKQETFTNLLWKIGNNAHGFQL